MGISKLWGRDKDGNRGFVFSHVKTIYYNWASKILLKTKLDEMDALIDAKIAKAMMSSQQINDANKVPTSALAYTMGQNITKNTNDIAQINSDFISASNIDNLISIISDKPYDQTYPIYIKGEVMGVLTNDVFQSTGKGVICKVGGDIADLFLSSEAGQAIISGRLTLSTKAFKYDSYVTRSDLGPFRLYREDKHATSISLTIEDGVYIFIGYIYSYSVPSDEPLIAIVGSADSYNDGTQHKSIYKLHDNSVLNLNVNVTTDRTHKMTVSLSRNNGAIEHLYMALLRIK